MAYGLRQVPQCWQQQHHPSGGIVPLARHRSADGLKPDFTSIFIVKMPLVGLEATAILPSPLSDAAAVHEAVAIDVTEGPWLFDFLPREPRNPRIIARLLAGDSVPAMARVRQIRALPPSRLCFSVGACSLSEQEAVARAKEFQREWNRDLQLFKMDCRHHTRELVAALFKG